MKKRQIALGMAALLFASGLAACGAKKEETKESAKESAKETEAKADAGEEKAEDLKADLKLFTYPIGQWGKSESVDALLENFNKKYPNVHVSVEYLDYTNGDDQVNTAIEGKAAPDLIMEGPERLVANWGAKGLMVDLKDIFEDEASQDIYKNVKDACASSDGKYYEYPLAMVAHCMAINKTMFEKADALQYIDAEKHTWTTENFFKAVEAINKSGQNDVLAVYCGGQGGDQGTRALVNNLYGGTFTNKEHTEYTVDSPENIKALEELKKAKGVNFDPALVGGDEINLFRNGTLAMSLCWNSLEFGSLRYRRALFSRRCLYDGKFSGGTEYGGKGAVGIGKVSWTESHTDFALCASSGSNHSCRSFDCCEYDFPDQRDLGF